MKKIKTTPVSITTRTAPPTFVHLEVICWCCGMAFSAILVHWMAWSRCFNPIAPSFNQQNPELVPIIQEELRMQEDLIKNGDH